MKKKLFAVLLMLMVLCVPAMAENEMENEWVNILLMGGDARSQTRTERTDCMIILSVNYEENLLKMTSIMRDTYVKMAGQRYSAKINAANVYGGTELAINTVNECFDTDIEDYVLVNMADLVAIIDLVGGVTIDVDNSERGLINTYAAGFIKTVENYEGESYLRETGLVHLNGLLAMSYTRNRYSDNDFNRVMRQQEVLLALGKQVQEMDFDAAMALTDDIMQYVDTSLDQEELKALATLCMVVDVEAVEQFRIPVHGTFTTGATEEDNYRIHPNLEENTRLLKEFIYGEAAE